EIGTAAHAEVAEVALAAADVFAEMLAAYRKKKKAPSGEALRKRIRKLAERPVKKMRRTKADSSSTWHAPWTEYEQLAISKALERGRSVYHVSAHIDPSCAMPVAARQLVHNALKAMGEVLAIRPETGARETVRIVEAALASDRSSAEIDSKCHIPSIDAKISVNAVRVPKPAQKARVKTPSGTEQTDAPTATPDVLAAPAEGAVEINDLSASSPTSTVTSAENILRVDAERIDNVLNLVGELIIGKSMMQQALHELALQHPKEALRGRLVDAMAFQARVLNDLQRSVMKIRMVPVEQLFRRFPRMVRDVARQCGRDVQLEISGQDTDLDKSILDTIAEPLTHLVRNAVGHGIEKPEDRKKAGKPVQGTIRLDAYHQGNQVIVEVRDDGRGIDSQRVK